LGDRKPKKRKPPVGAISFVRVHLFGGPRKKKPNNCEKKRGGGEADPHNYEEVRRIMHQRKYPPKAEMRKRKFSRGTNPKKGYMPKGGRWEKRSPGARREEKR